MNPVNTCLGQPVDSASGEADPRSPSRDVADPRGSVGLAEPAARAANEEALSTANEFEFAALRSALRGSGCLARGNDLGRLLEDQRCGDFVALAKLIGTAVTAGGCASHFAWRSPSPTFGSIRIKQFECSASSYKLCGACLTVAASMGTYSRNVRIDRHPVIQFLSFTEYPS